MQSETKYSMVIAASSNGVIGQGNKLPWHCPSEMLHFKLLTTGKIIVMGRKTFESLNHIPLPNRYNIIVSRNPRKTIRHVSTDNLFQVSVVPSIERVSVELKRITTHPVDEVMIIGGKSIYEAMKPQVSAVHLSIVHGNVSGDTFYDWVSEFHRGGVLCPRWKLESSTIHPKTDVDDYGWTYQKLVLRQ